jgi:U3 small nucleolar RNA-associated protein 18
MPRQRSREASATRQNDKALASERDDEMDSDNDSLGMLEEDEEEAELARLVLGDMVGFKARLGQRMDLGMDDGSEDGNKVASEDSEGEVGLENVDDAEVTVLWKLSTTKINFE